LCAQRAKTRYDIPPAVILRSLSGSLHHRKNRYGVATFYNQFRFLPKGKYHIVVCRGTACHVKGSAKLLETVMRSLKIEPGRTTRDRMFSLETVACMGACALSPVMCLNGDFYAKVSNGKALKLLDECRQKEAGKAAA